MKHLFVLLLLVSCGKNVTKTRFIENEFDASEIEKKLANHEERIKDLETLTSGLVALTEKVSDMEREMGDNFDSVNDFIDELKGKLADLTNQQLKDAVNEVNNLKTTIETLATKTELMKIESICESREQMLVVGNKSYAVMSTIVSVDSKNLASNVHLGEITDGSYKLTDGSNVTFSVVNGKVTNCSNSTK